MENWRRVWRHGIRLVLSIEALQALRQALLADDPRLIQGGTTRPRPLAGFGDFPAEGAGALSFGPWQAEGILSVAQVEGRFVRLCDQVDRRTGEPGSARSFVAWLDDTPRDVMRRELLAEVLRELRLRGDGELSRPLAS